ncbi:MAG: replication initiation protein, partial [Solibacillus sp.]
QDGKEKDYAYDLLDEFNTRMDYPLKSQDVMMVLESAYSGRYFGAKKEYVEQLLDLYSLTEKDMPICLGKRVWHKHKKKREDRKNSHVYEWEKDIIHWIGKEKAVSEPFIWCTQKELCTEVGISSSTLNHLLKGAKKLIKTVSGKGRNAKTGWTTVELYLAYIVWLKKQKAD